METNPFIFPIFASLLLGLGVYLVVSTQYRPIVKWLGSRIDVYRGTYKGDFDALFMKVNLKKFAILHLALVVLIPLLILLLSGNLFFAFLLGILTFAAPKIHLSRQKKKRLERLNLQLLDGLGLVANALRAGLTLPQAFQNVANQMVPPINEEIQLMLREYKLGISFDAALKAMAQRVPTPNMEIFVSSILISRRTGGDIAEVLERMGESMKEIFRLEGKISALTSQGKAQGMVLGLLPFFLGVVLYFMDKTMILPLVTTPQGYAICMVIVLFWAIGIFFIWKIVNVEV